MKSLQKYGLSFILAIAMTFVSLWAGGVNVRAEETDTNQRTMEITEDDIQSNAYETYYYSDDISYTYQGKAVSFISETKFETEDGIFDLKNKKTNVTVDQSEDGTVSISLSDLSVPVGQISGAWNLYSGGTVQVVYQTDIPGVNEVRTNDATALSNPITLEHLSPGTYHLTDGTIYERANSYSPGYDFGDGQGKRTEGFFGTLPDITFTVGNADDVYLGVKTEAKVYDDFENDIWLQYQQKELQIGDTATIYPWRTEQITTDKINNDVARPNFNFEIIKGEDVISLEETRSTDDTTVLEDGSFDKATVTALKEGTAVVQVTYDARDYKGQHWDACSDVNTGYVVFTVGETGTATIATNEEFDNWRHYDTIYYTEGETTPYTFTVNTENAESVKVTLNGIEIKGEGNTYTANLENRSNIIGIEATDAAGNVKSVYRVIDARFMKVNVENKVTGDDYLEAGDTAVISFEGVTMPVYKLATIYNPQFGSGAAYIAYNNETLGDFKGSCRQWDLATENSFEVEFTRAGNYTFTSNGIHSSWWGDALGSDMTKEGAGDPNMNAESHSDVFCVLPDFTVEVNEAETAPVLSINVSDKTLYVGQTFQLTAKNYEEDAQWSSSDTSVAEVNGSGLVTAKKQGTAVITASAGGQTASCTVTVKNGDDPVKSITVEQTKGYSGKLDNTIYIGKTVEYTATVDAEAGANTEVVWSLSDDSSAQIVYVSEDGYTVTVMGIKGDTETQVICTAKEGSASAGSTLKVRLSDYYTMLGSTLHYLDVDGLTLKDDAYVEALRKAYDGLSDSQKETLNNQYSTAYSKLMQAEEKMAALQLEADKEDAVSGLDAYKDLSEYREEQQKELQQIIEDAKEKIESAENADDIEAILAEAKKAMDAVKTDAQLKEEEAAAGNTEETPSTEAPAQTMPSTQTPSAQTPAATDITAEQAKTKMKKAKASGKSVKLKWKKVKDAKKYQIFRANSKNGKYKKIKTVSKKKTTFVDKKVKRNKKYFYKVRSYKVVNGKKVFSSFSKVIAVKVK